MIPYFSLSQKKMQAYNNVNDLSSSTVRFPKHGSIIDVFKFYDLVSFKYNNIDFLKQSSNDRGKKSTIP